MTKSEGKPAFLTGQFVKLVLFPLNLPQITGREGRLAPASNKLLRHLFFKDY